MKARSHHLVPTITCTSSNVVRTVLQAAAQIPDVEIWYGPDTYMGNILEVLFAQLSQLPEEEIRALQEVPRDAYDEGEVNVEALEEWGEDLEDPDIAGAKPPAGCERVAVALGVRVSNELLRPPQPELTFAANRDIVPVAVHDPQLRAVTDRAVRPRPGYQRPRARPRGGLGGHGPSGCAVHLGARITSAA